MHSLHKQHKPDLKIWIVDGRLDVIVDAHHVVIEDLLAAKLAEAQLAHVQSLNRHNLKSGTNVNYPFKIL